MTSADDDKEFPLPTQQPKCTNRPISAGPVTRSNLIGAGGVVSEWRRRLPPSTNVQTCEICDFVGAQKSTEMRMIAVHCVGFSCSRMSGRVALLVVAIAANLFSVQSQRIVTRTMTVTETLTEVRMSTTRMLCAKMVNATGFCRRRRGKWLVEPHVLTFDEDMDMVDRLMDPTLPVVLETTLVPVIPVIPADYPAARNNLHVPIAPSMSWVPEARPGMSILSQIMQIISQSLASRTRSTTTVTMTKSMTSTVTSMLTSMRTFFVQNCTPSPFPFSLCSR